MWTVGEEAKSEREIINKRQKEGDKLGKSKRSK
jgi:hypothetical protein